MPDYWEPRLVLCAVTWSKTPVTRAGYVYHGLGLHRAWPETSEWTLTHLNSGHAILYIKGSVAEAFPIAAKIADATDWTFDGLLGWKNMDPELPAKLRAIAEEHRGRVYRNGAIPSNDELARAVLTELEDGGEKSW